ncbi:hypothetical protein CLOLEP_01901 [[Clostridium] leptum DSM 753]|uniref:Uncharacterized protein n=1 Tax=[Clostridium] leptum DSM 753 TaxID=428125 RepID=A7VTK9_9FIRM|nr:hypothetical protein CLOLEP_01901 [[Clostridium] leptum DSM 753]
MIGSNVPVFLSHSLALLKTYFSGGKASWFALLEVGHLRWENFEKLT